MDMLKAAQRCKTVAHSGDDIPAHARMRDEHARGVCMQKLRHKVLYILEDDMLAAAAVASTAAAALFDLAASYTLRMAMDMTYGFGSDYISRWWAESPGRLGPGSVSGPACHRSPKAR